MAGLSTRRRGSLLAGLLLGLGAALAAPAQTSGGVDTTIPADEAARRQRETETRSNLEKVRAEIKAIAERTRQVEAQKGSVAAELREREVKVAGASREVRTLDEQLRGQEQSLAALQKQRQQLDARLDRQRAGLASLLRSAYALGRHEELKLLLQQDRVDAAERVLAYNRYFQRARLDRIGALLKDLADLAHVQAQIRSQNAELDATRTTRRGELAELERERGERLALLNQIEASLKDQRARLEALGKDEKALVDLIEHLHDIFADIPKQLDAAEPFGRRRGKLAWPLAGKVAVAYGATDDSGRAISGMVIAARSGADVRAISHGRVAYADWLKGYGLLLILDHGDGYMSLYGYNEALLKDVGDWVDAGEAVAQAGSSGGRRTPGLYFELREKGKPLDPRSWLKPQGR